MSKKARFPSEKAVLLGAGLLGAYVLYKATIGQGAKDGLPTGSLGGTDEPEYDLGEYQGFDVDPNNAIYAPIYKESQEVLPILKAAYAEPSPVNAFEIDTPTGTRSFNPYVTEHAQDLEQSGYLFSAPNQIIGVRPTGEIAISDFETNSAYGSFLRDKYITGKEPIYDAGDNLIGYDDTKAGVQYIKNVPVADAPTGLLGTGISAQQFALGSAGLSGSYLTSAGEVALKQSPTGVAFLKQTFQGGLESIPLFGKKASKIFSTKAVEAGGKSLLKKSAKVGVGILPFVGTAAGAEFDVAIDKRSRPLAYTANAAGDVLGGALGALGAPFGGFPGIAGAIGGQVIGEQVVYKGNDFFTNLWSKLYGKDEEKTKDVFTPLFSAPSTTSPFRSIGNINNTSTSGAGKGASTQPLLTQSIGGLGGSQGASSGRGGSSRGAITQNTLNKAGANLGQLQKSGFISVSPAFTALAKSRGITIPRSSGGGSSSGGSSSSKKSSPSPQPTSGQAGSGFQSYWRSRH